MDLGEFFYDFGIIQVGGGLAVVVIVGVTTWVLRRGRSPRDPPAPPSGPQSKILQEGENNHAAQNSPGTVFIREAHGPVTIHHPSTPVPPTPEPAEPPKAPSMAMERAPPDFTGRAKEIEQVVASFRSGSGALIHGLVGKGGVGNARG